MRCMRKDAGGKWLKEDPLDLTHWMWRNDGEEAAVVDDIASTYYCSRSEMMDTYRAAWEKERRGGDKRKAAMFIDLDRQLFEKESA